MRITRDYGNGIVFTADCRTMKECIKELSSADDLFSDMKCAAKDDSGQVVTSNDVHFNYRKNDHGEFFEQVCQSRDNGGKLRYFKRNLSIYNDNTERLYVKRKVEDKTMELNPTLGYAGWFKLPSPSERGGGYQNRQQQPQQQYQQPSAPAAAPPPPAAQPQYQQPAVQAEPYEEIPF